jgi:hypothetical protein
VLSLRLNSGGGAWAAGSEPRLNCMAMGEHKENVLAALPTRAAHDINTRRGAPTQEARESSSTHLAELPRQLLYTSSMLRSSLPRSTVCGNSGALHHRCKKHLGMGS